MRRRVVVAVLSSAFLLMAACGSGDEETDGSDSSAGQETETDDATERSDESGDAPATDKTNDATADEEGSDSDTDEATTDTDESTASSYPITVDHNFGSTTIEARPERVVTLNVQWTDAMVAMGQAPTAYVLSAFAGETDLYPWQVGLLDDAERIDAVEGLPFEAIAALQPDLILFTFATRDPGDYETLSAIAPTIAGVSDLQVDPWSDQVRVLGQVLDDPDTAEAVIASVDGEVAELAAVLPGLAGKTYTFANYVPGDSIYVIADPDDGASELFNGLGMELDPDIVALDTAVVGRIQISLEEIGLLQADLVGVLLNGTDPSEVIGLDTLPSSQSGALIDFAFADVVGLNTPTPLSVPYLLELMRPSLELVGG
ncbi:MAG: ABC transporter substrate-binding protein [Actinomycetota bacterium]